MLMFEDVNNFLLFMAGTSTQARRHIREWRELFIDLGKISEVMAQEFIKRHKKRKYFRQSLDRLVEKGLIARKSRYLIPTKRGLFLFGSLIEPHSWDKKDWSGKWYLMSFDIPVQLNVKRDRLRRILKIYDFYPLQKSVWVGPDKFQKDIWEFIVNEEIQDYCKVMIVDVIEGDEEIKKHFGLLRG